MCPPKGSNTALNNDLEKVGNGSLAVDLRDDLVEAGVEIFLVGPHNQYVKTMKATVNQNNLMAVYLGFQTLPTNQQLSIWKVYSSAFEGIIKSPWFGESIKPTYYRTSHSGTYHVEFPRNLKDLVGDNGSLVIELKVDTHDNEESLEYVSISKSKQKDFFVFGSSLGSSKKKNFYSESSKNWMDAEFFCAKNGGHLASITTKVEKDKLDSVVGGFSNDYAIGAKKYNSGWEWFDGSPWNHNSSVFDFNTEDFKGNCLLYNAKDRSMYTGKCTKTSLFICNLGKTTLRGSNNVTLVYNKTNIPDTFSDIIVKHYQPKAETFDFSNKKQTGFSLKWKLVKGSIDYEIEVDDAKGCIKTPEAVGNNGNFTIILDIPSNQPTNVIQDEIFIELRSGKQKLDRVKQKMSYNFFKKEYFLYEDSKEAERSWQEADSMCEKQGGRLASVHSLEELHAVGKVIGGYWKGVWLGGRRIRAGHWVWSDNSAWDYDNWDTEDPEITYGSQGDTNNCTVIWDDLTWWDQPCISGSYHLNRVACQKSSWVYDQHVQVPANTTKLRFTKDNFTSAKFYTWWEYEVVDHKLVEEDKNISFVSFEFDWDVNNEAENDTKCELGDWVAARGEFKYKNIYYIRLANLANEAAAKNIATDWLLSKALEYKVDMIKDGSLQYEDWCKHGEIQEEYKVEVFEGYMHAVGLLGSSEIIR